MNNLFAKLSKECSYTYKRLSGLESDPRNYVLASSGKFFCM